MTEIASSYRPHDSGHDYYAPGIYLITLVVRKRRENGRIFGVPNDDPKHPEIELNGLGRAVMECWRRIPEFEASKGRKVRIHAAICMPDHFHGVIEVVERMPVSVGQVIWGFKVACTKCWRELQESIHQPRTADELGRPSLVDRGLDLHRMSKKQRAEYYAQHPEAQQPLWDDNYDDTICLNNPETGKYCERHFRTMTQYVNDNPRRAIIRRLRPEFMRRCLHVRIGERDYAAFGNLFLLRWARKVQVFCHRRDALTHLPYEKTEDYRKECEQWEAEVMAGQTVIVTPGISRGEQLMKETCLKNGWPLIHLQKDAIGAYWKPEEKRFNACSNGRLLILAPWTVEALGEVNGVPAESDYAMFHNLNKLAEEICLFEGEAMILKD